MPDVTRAVIARPADRCFTAFCEVRHLPVWVPGLRRARVVVKNAGGQPEEVLFEFGEKQSYVLRYTYDAARRRVEWTPTIGRRDAVSGFAEFVEHERGCELLYAVEPATSHTDEGRAADPGPLLDAFRRWIEAT